MTLWAARVGDALDPAVAEFLRADDAELLPYDCAATVEHATRLLQAGLLSVEELEEVRAQVGGVELLAGDEDVHSAIERHLGQVGRKIHAGRSRNDQVAAALRLYVADACVDAQDAIERLRTLLSGRAAAEAGTLMPGTWFTRSLSRKPRLPPHRGRSALRGAVRRGRRKRAWNLGAWSFVYPYWVR